MDAAVAVVGMACRYPDADSPTALWENALAQRRAFRRMPSQRLSLDDYFDADPTIADSIYATEAAVIDIRRFTHVAFRNTYGGDVTLSKGHGLVINGTS